MKIALKKKKLKSGKYSLFIEYYHGTTVNDNGKTVHKREFEYLIINSTTKENKQKNKETQKFAEKVLAIRQAEYHQDKYGIVNSDKSNFNFLEYYKLKTKERESTSINNYNSWLSVLIHLESFCNSHTTFNDINLDFIKGFKNYLNNKAVTKSGLPLSQNTKNSYYNKFKACIRSAFEDGYLKENLTLKVKSIPVGETHQDVPLSGQKLKFRPEMAILLLLPKVAKERKSSLKKLYQNKKSKP